MIWTSTIAASGIEYAEIPGYIFSLDDWGSFVNVDVCFWPPQGFKPLQEATAGSVPEAKEWAERVAKTLGK